MGEGRVGNGGGGAGGSYGGGSGSGDGPNSAQENKGVMTMHEVTHKQTCVGA